MKRLLLGMTLLYFGTTAQSQATISGSITDGQSGMPIASATVEFSGLGTTATNDRGQFEFRRAHPGTYRVRISSVGYRTLDSSVRYVPGTALQIALRRIDLFMQPIEVRALRAGDLAPFTKTNMTKRDIEQVNLGQDLPFLLNQTPSVVINSDAGNGVGYTGIYIRGTDATRINMTLNGIPYNDAESQGIYFVDLPDFASSVGSIQIQRGVGTSSNGAGAFGASMNFSTNEFNEKPYGSLNNSFGSFNTWKNTVMAGSGLLDDHFTIDARLSRITSDGYIDRASSNLRSFYLSGAWIDKQSSLRLNVLSGVEKTYQAWNGIPEAKVRGDLPALNQHYQNNKGSLYFTEEDSLNLFRSNDRTYNYFTYQNQTDNYQQDHYQLFFNHQFNADLSLNTAIFYTRGKGYYEEYHDQGDSANAKYSAYGLPPFEKGGDTLQSTSLIRQRWLDNYFYGAIFSLQYKHGHSQLTAGGGLDHYYGKHYGIVTWAANGGFPDNYQYYYEPAYKTDFNVYAKWQQQISAHWTGFLDLQYRHIGYQIDGFDDNPALFVHALYDFFNPKAGITYSQRDWEVYLSYSQASHEPNRDDYEASVQQQPTPETLHDFEAGYQKKNLRYSYGVTLYYMRYRDQLVLNGKINDVGSYTRINIPQSYRLGIELQGSVKLLDWFSADGNLAFSQNKVLNYTEYDDDYDNGGQVSYTYKKTDIAFSPAVVGAASLHFLPFRDLQLSLPAKYVSKLYLDNAQKENRKLNGYYVQNFQATWTIRNKLFQQTQLIFQLNNIFNRKYEPNGYTYSYIYGGQLVTENFLFPMAGTNFMIALNIRL